MVDCKVSIMLKLIIGGWIERVGKNGSRDKKSIFKEINRVWIKSILESKDWPRRFEKIKKYCD